MAREWQTPRQADTCCVCGRGYAAPETIRAYLFETAAGYERRDCCADCALPTAGEALASWRVRRAEPTRPAGPVFDRRALFELFVSLHDAAGADRLRLRFCLALLLWRKRVLKFIDARPMSEAAPAVEVWRFRSGSADATEEHAVLRPDLDESQLEQLSTQLEGLIAGASGATDLAVADPRPDAEPAHD